MNKFNAFLFGSLYNSDERVRAGIDKAGNISFIFCFLFIYWHDIRPTSRQS